MSALPAPARRWYQRRLPWFLLLLLIAVVSFSSYVRHSLNFRDEGGTEVLYAQRLLNGERPFLDVILGYNLMWFYPIVGLFKLFGVNYVLLRGYCFALSTVAALVGFLAVERASRRPWLGFLVGLLLVAVPGMTFKNYMPFLSVLNSACLLFFALAPGRLLGRAVEEVPEEEARGPRSQPWLWVLLGGLLLGLTFLIRIDLGLFFSCLWLGGCWLRALAPGTSGGQRGLFFLAPAAIAALVLLVHWPVYADAQRRGFGPNFVAGYTAWPKTLWSELQERLHGPKASPTTVVASTAVTPAPAAAPAAPAATPAPNVAAAQPANEEILKRRGLDDALSAEKLKVRLLAVLLYLPLVSISLLVLWSLVRIGRGLRAGEATTYRRGLAGLLVLGGALTVFPQYFFFRPDGPHLSEFSPAFWTAVTCATALLARSLPGQPRTRPHWAVVAMVVFLSLHAGLFLWRMLPDRWVGTIWARKGRTYEFKAENGVNVYLTRKEQDGLLRIHRLIRGFSAPDEYLVAYPYQPAFNVLANRRTYEKEVYVDNATAGPWWNEFAIQRFEKYRPAVVILSDWEINGTPESRFSVWAAKAKAWLEANYTRQGEYLDFEVYTRDKEMRFPQPEIPEMVAKKK